MLAVSGGKTMPFLISLLFLFAAEASANVIVVSDIDDTIRHANVRELHKLTVLKQTEFSGLSKLYRQLEKSVDRFEYVSGVPKQVRAVSEFFIFWNLFPQGRLFARDTANHDTVTHKTKAIDQVVRENVPSAMIMLGDNGEKDPVIYKAASEKYQNIKTVVFIHQLYDVELPENQIAYLTSIDLTLSMYAQGLVKSEAVDEVLAYAADKMLSKKKNDREEFFPRWAECKMFFANYSRPQVSLTRAQDNIVRAYESFLNDRCL